MYDKKDPRVGLKNQSEKVSKVEHTEFADSKHIKMNEFTPLETILGTKTWWSRGQNFYLAYSEAVDGEMFERREQVDEYVVLLPDKSSQAVITWGNQDTVVDGFSLVVVPKGESKIMVNNGGRIVRLFSVWNNDLADFPINKASYAEKDPNVSKFQPWTESPQGSKVRAYSLDIIQEEGRFGRIFRCSTFMVNCLYPYDGPREKLSPHFHDDFEQCSLILEGEFVHHLRWPWTPDKEQWRPDEHEYCRGPAVTIIPAGVIHTSESIGSGLNILVDIFCPPRIDFANQPDWVLNAEDYPMD